MLSIRCNTCRSQAASRCRSFSGNPPTVAATSRRAWSLVSATTSARPTRSSPRPVRTSSPVTREPSGRSNCKARTGSRCSARTRRAAVSSNPASRSARTVRAASRSSTAFARSFAPGPAGRRSRNNPVVRFTTRSASEGLRTRRIRLPVARRPCPANHCSRKVSTTPRPSHTHSPRRHDNPPEPWYRAWKQSPAQVSTTRYPNPQDGHQDCAATTQAAARPPNAGADGCTPPRSSRSRPLRGRVGATLFVVRRVES